MGDLTGRRIVITRSTSLAAPLQREIAEHGGQALAIPFIRIEDRSEPLTETERAALDDAVAIAVTSSRAARLLAQALRDGALDPSPTALWAAVGPTTADAMTSEGLPEAMVPSRHTGAALAEAIAEHRDIRDTTVVLARAADGHPDLPAVLRTHGADPVELALYRTHPSAPSEASLQEAGNCDTWVFYSPSGVESAITNVDRTVLDSRTLVAIGPSTLAALEAHQLPVAAVAEQPTVDAILMALITTGGPHGDSAPR